MRVAHLDLDIKSVPLRTLDELGVLFRKEFILPLIVALLLNTTKCPFKCGDARTFWSQNSRIAAA